MPARIIKQSICTSESMASLTWFEQILFIRLIVSADDYGRFDARPAIIRGALFPLDDGVTVKAIRDALHKLSTQGMINLYEVGGKPTLELTAWCKHNKPRAKESKYPAPPECFDQTQASANKCKQMNADAPVIRNSNSELVIRNSGSNTPVPAREAKDGRSFTLFWEDYPNKADRDDAWEAWRALNPDDQTVGQIKAGLDAWKKSGQWLDDGGRYIPSAAKWLTKRRWECPPAAAVNAQGRQLDGDEIAAIKRMMGQDDEPGQIGGMV